MSDTAVSDTDVLFRDDVDDMAEMPTRASRRIVTAWTVVFAALVVAGAGFVAGIQMEKHNAPAAAAIPGGFRGLGAGQFPGAATGQFPGAASGQVPGSATNGTGSGTNAPSNGSTGATGTTGTVKLIDGANVYITTSDGTTVKVTTSPTSKVTQSVDSSLNELRAGDTVVVHGATGADGTIAATTIDRSS